VRRVDRGVLTFTQPETSQEHRSEEPLHYITSQVTLKLIEQFPGIRCIFDRTRQQSNVQPSPSQRNPGTRVREIDKTILDTVRLLGVLQDPSISLPEESLAEHMANLSLYLHQLGLMEEALAMQTFCEAMYQELAQRDDSYARPLVISIDHLSNFLSELGYRDQALDRTQEAVRLCRDLISNDAPHHDSILDLARCLNNLSLRFSDVGRRQNALDAIQECADLHRRVANAYPETARDFASALGNLSHTSANCRRPPRRE
jgi:hypothetical protein